uniref:Isochorismatase family protein n=1 Tax=Schlesneria paludicola TaxID=360056 RepID=A0A7C4QLQ6_9PLAN
MLLMPAHADESAPFRLTLRSRLKQDTPDPQQPVVKTVAWAPRETAIIVCDMWDRHWCKSAEQRVGELAGPMNEMLKQARSRGAFIIHAPSSVTEFYAGTPQRRRAQQAPFAPTPIPLATAQRWGTAWCWTDGAQEGVLPIDDSDMGCDCAEKCPIEPPWTRQHLAIELFPEDALTDHGQETWNLLRERGIRHVILCGVHLNMCVLGRPFGIRQLVKLGQEVVLLRDMTDTMYNPERPPGVSHFAGTELMVRHVETYWCPSAESSDLTGKPPFRFRSATAERSP